MNETVLWAESLVTVFSVRNVQHEVNRWAIYNFGEPNSDDSLQGMGEELGELLHALLKKKQGIRGTPQQHDADARDAIGDLIVYTCHFAANSNCDLQAVLGYEFYHDLQTAVQLRDGERLKSGKITLANCWKRIAAAYGRLCEYDDEGYSSSTVQNGLKILYDCLALLCCALKFNLQAIVKETWSQVRLRDWKRYPAKGRPVPSAESVDKLADQLLQPLVEATDTDDVPLPAGALDSLPEGVANSLPALAPTDTRLSEEQQKIVESGVSLGVVPRPTPGSPADQKNKKKGKPSA